MYVCVCKRKPSEPVKEVIELAGQNVIIPYSNSQAHRIAEKYKCNIFFVEDVVALKQILEILKRLINRRYEIIEINDVRWYPSIVDNIETLVDNDEVYVEYYNAEVCDGYYAKHKKSGIEVNVTDLCG